MISTNITQKMKMQGVGDGVKRAWARTAIALGWQGVADMKGRVHRLTGTLSRSIHVSVREIGHEGDLAAAEQSEIKETISPNWDGGSYEVLAGSWIPYAKPEAERGGSHDFFTPAVTVIERSIKRTFKRAMEEEF